MRWRNFKRRKCLPERLSSSTVRPDRQVPRREATLTQAEDPRLTLDDLLLESKTLSLMTITADIAFKADGPLDIDAMRDRCG